MPTWKNLWRTAFQRKQVEQELDDEVNFYLDTLTQQGVDAGMREQDARRAARLQVESVVSLKEGVRDVRTGAFMERIIQDMRYAFRSLAAKPGFTAAALLVLALGIGANSAVFSLVNAFLLKPIAVSEPERLLGIYSHDRKHPDQWRAFSYPNYVDLRAADSPFSNIAAFGVAMVGAKEGDHTRRVFTSIVSSNYFSTLGVPMLRGRAFLPSEEKPGADLSVIVTYPYWKRTGGDPQIVGKRLTLNGQLFTVVGVTPEGFTGTMAMLGPELVFPLGAYDLVENDSFGGRNLALRDNYTLLLFGRLKPGVTRQAAENALHSEDKDQSLLASPMARLGASTRPRNDGQLRTVGVLLLSLAAVVLLIASLNLANMMLAKGAARRKEIAIRLAIGGSRQRIIQQLVTEALVLAVLGGSASLLLAGWSTRLLIASLARLAPLDLVYNASPDVRVLAATAIFCGVSTILFGLFPAWRLSRLDLAPDLKLNKGEDNSSGKRRLFSLANNGVMAQLALSLMMLTAAGLFIHNALRAADIRPGFSLDNQILAETDVSFINLDKAHGRQLYAELQNRLQQVPGVKSVAMAATVPFGIISLGQEINSSDVPISKDHQAVPVRFNIVTANYFDTLDIPLLRGRSFNSADGHVVVLDKIAADKLWPNSDPLGKQIRLNKDPATDKVEICQVVGVVGNVRENILGGGDEPHVYVSIDNEYQANMQIHVRAEKRLLPIIRQQIQAIDSRLPLLSLKTMRDHLESGEDIWVVRTGARIFEIFGAAALLLAVIGLYAVNAYTVARRTREIGIRMAVGADASSALRMVLGEGLRVIAVGTAVGLLLGLALGRVLSGFLYDIPSIDPLVIGSASLILALAALVACYFPARRASRIDPLISLRYE